MPTFIWMMDSIAPALLTSVTDAKTIEYHEQDSRASKDNTEADKRDAGHSHRTEARTDTFNSSPASSTDPGHEHSTWASGNQKDRGYEGDFAATRTARRTPVTEDLDTSTQDRGTDNSAATRSKKDNSPTKLTVYRQTNA